MLQLLSSLEWLHHCRVVELGRPDGRTHHTRRYSSLSVMDFCFADRTQSMSIAKLPIIIFHMVMLTVCGHLHRRERWHSVSAAKLHAHFERMHAGQRRASSTNNLLGSVR